MTRDERIKVSALFGIVFARVIEAFQPGHAYSPNGVLDFAVFSVLATVFTLLAWWYMKW